MTPLVIALSLDGRPGNRKTALPVVSLDAGQEPVKGEFKEPGALERQINLIVMSASGYSSDITQAYKKALPLALQLYLDNPLDDSNKKRVQGIALLAGGKENHSIYLIFVDKKDTPEIVKGVLPRAQAEAEAIVKEKPRTTFVAQAPKKEPESFKYTLALAELVSSGQPVLRMDLIHAISELNLAGPQYNELANGLTDFITRDNNVELSLSDIKPVLDAIEQSVK